MLRKRFAFFAAAAGLTTAALVAAPVVPASAHAKPAPKATGSVALAGPIQYMKFAAYPRGHYHGSVQYTNFTYPASNTHVWNIAGTTLPATDPLVFTLGGSTYTHSMTTTAVTPLSANATMFTGTGLYTGPGNITWTVKGFVYGSSISFTIKYNAPNAGYSLHAHGYITPSGAVFGKAYDSNAKTLNFTMPAGSALQVLHYHARVAFASVWDHSARFGYTIPKSAPAGLAGLHIVVKVHDGGRGYTHDTMRFGVNAPTGSYTITSGNIFVRH
jgi:hypothetical protein